MVERPHHERDTSDLERRLNALAFLARVHAAAYAPPRARVRYGPDDGQDTCVSNWLPWVTLRAQNDRSWWAPEVGEQVLVLCPAGDINQGLILGAVNYLDQPAPADRPTLRRVIYADGTIEEYDRDAHHMLIDLTASGGTLTIKTGTTEVIIQPDHVFIRADQIDLNDDR